MTITASAKESAREEAITVTTVSCTEKPCPFPVEPGQTLCGYHIEMFASEASPSELSVEATDDDVLSAIFYDKSISIEKRGMVSTEEWLEEKRWKKTQKKLVGMDIRRRRKELGKCIHCLAAVKAEKVVCDGCLARGRTRRLELITRGMCVVCGTKKSANGTTRCLDCSDKRKPYQAAYAHAKFERRKAARLCTVCGNSNDTATTSCSACKAAQSERAAKRYRAVREKEVCVWCRSLPPIEGKTHCVGCATKNSKKAIRRYEKLKKLRMCIKCAKQRRAKGHLMCPACRENDRVKQLQRYYRRKAQRVSAA